MLKYQIDTKENKAFMKQMAEDLLRFGKSFPSPFGGSYYLGDDGTPWVERPRETWITCRMIHVYSIGCLMGWQEYESLVDAGIKGLMGELHDDTHGGWFSGVTAEHDILPNKQCYTHAFVILAATSAVLAGRPDGNKLLEEALQLFDDRFWDDEEGLAYDMWDTQFTKLDSYRGLNANMHTVEAFLAVADAIGDEKYRIRAGRIIRRVIGWAKENHWRIPEHFTKEWVADLECNKERPADPFKPYGATPGHGIEWARLIVQWAMSMYEEDSLEAAAYIEAAEQLFVCATSDAWNADGAPGIVYTTDWDGNPVVRDRMHWTLAEAINTSAILYRVTEKEEYAKLYSEFMQYLDQKVLDHVNGSWFHQLDANNQLLDTVWPGKSDLYHAFQATLIPYNKVDTSIACCMKGKCSDTKNIDVIALGELLIDFTENGFSVSGNPILEANPGGAPCNVLAMLQNLGKRTAFIGKVGKDAFGQYLTETVRSIGIDTTNLVQDEEVPTTLAFVHTAADGDRSFSFYRNPGADMCLSKDEIDYGQIDTAKIFHFGTLSMTHEGVREATKEAVAHAKEQGLLISFDPNYRPLLWKDAETAKEMMRYGFSACDILKISDDEIMFVTGKDTVSEAMDVFFEEFKPRLACVTCGKKGSIAVYNDKRMPCEAILTSDTIETTGAGDTFMACILNYVLEHGLDNLSIYDIMEMQEFAAGAASLVTTKKGALKVMPKKDEVIDWLLPFREAK